MSDLTTASDTTAATDDALAVVAVRATSSAVWWRAAIAVCAGLLAVVGWHLRVRTLPLLLALFALIGLIGCVRALFAVVRVGPDGVRFRSRLRRRVVSWPDLFQLIVHERLLSRSVYLKTEAGAKYDLVVPRSSRLTPDRAFDRDIDRLARRYAQFGPTSARVQNTGRGYRRWMVVGLIVVSLLAVSVPDRPWGWIGDGQATAMPSACALTEALASRFNARESTDSPEPETATTSECLWDMPHGLAMDIGYRRYPREGLHSGADIANQGLSLSVDYVRSLLYMGQDMPGERYLSPGDVIDTVDARPVLGRPGKLIQAPNGLLFGARIENVIVVVEITGSKDRATLDSIAAYAATIAEGQIR